MFPKSSRLPGHRIPTLIHKGTRIHHSLFTLYILPSPDDNTPSRIGCIIPAKLSKKATVRNKAKRILREAIKPYLNRIRVGMDVIVMSKTIDTNQKPDDISPAIHELFTQAELLPDNS